MPTGYQETAVGEERVSGAKEVNRVPVQIGGLIAGRPSGSLRICRIPDESVCRMLVQRIKVLLAGWIAASPEQDFASRQYVRMDRDVRKANDWGPLANLDRI